MRIGYDAVNWTAIPSTAAFVLGYVDGDYAWPQEAWDHFASLNIPAARIAVNPATIADVLDCEPGNPVDPSVNPSSAVPWAKNVRAAGKTATIYCSDENVPKMMAAFNAAGVLQPFYDVCDDIGQVYAWSGDNANVVSTQYNITSTLDYDNVADYWPGVDPEPSGTDSESTNTVSTNLEDMVSQQSQNGVAGLGWSAGSLKDNVIQVGYDGVAPTLRVVLQLATGGFVCADAWKPENGSDVLRLVGVDLANVRGVIARDTADTGNTFILYAPVDES